MPCGEADSAHGRSGGLPLTQVVSAACKVLASLAAHAKSAAVSLTASAQNYLAALRQSSSGLSAYCSRRAIAPPSFCMLLMLSCGPQCPCRCNAKASCRGAVLDSWWMLLLQVLVHTGAPAALWHRYNRGCRPAA